MPAYPFRSRKTPGHATQCLWTLSNSPQPVPGKRSFVRSDIYIDLHNQPTARQLIEWDTEPMIFINAWMIVIVSNEDPAGESNKPKLIMARTVELDTMIACDRTLIGTGYVYYSKGQV
jgi:hypothetical protein